MANYRVYAEKLNPEAHELDDTYKAGIECDGFVIMTDNEDRVGVAIQKINIKTIAMILNSDGTMKTAMKLVDVAHKLKGIMGGLVDSLDEAISDEDDEDDED